tara:strand:+ start:1249 stop:2901 length:1653 start_codon:yes stop_codon:yes gene_type:complete
VKDLNLENPIVKENFESDSANKKSKTIYEQMIIRAEELTKKPMKGGGESRVRIQHSKGRMTVWERIKVLTSAEPNFTFQNWGKNLDGAGIVTGIINVEGRDVAIYGHDFTVRAGSIDATNGSKIARQILMAGEHGIPLIGMNDSAGAYVPSGVGGLDGYSEAFAAMRKISGVVPSIQLMFGYNAGGGSYLPRQGSFVIQPENTFFGLTGPDVVREALGEDISANDLGGPKIHSSSGVVDLTASNEKEALITSLKLLSFLPDNNYSSPPFKINKVSLDDYIEEEAVLLQKTFSNSPLGFNTPFDIRLFLQNFLDFGEYFEIQKTRAMQLITAFARIGGHVIGLIANNSAFESGNIDTDSSRKGSKFIRFCNLFNIPVIFLEDVSGYAPGSEQEKMGIVQAGRELLDSIVDLRVPRLTLIIRNAFGGAYCAWNSYHVGSDFVFALPSARIAVMGSAGKKFAYKDEFKEIVENYNKNLKSGMEESEAASVRDSFMADLSLRYEREFLNPEEALRLGSVSRIVMPGYSRKVLGNALCYLLRHYNPSPMGGIQKE